MENRLNYMVNSKYTLDNHPIYVVDIELGSSISYNDTNFEEEIQEKKFFV